MGIKILADEVVAQIAAGEVVERPASVVKEMLENALDAGATQIRVEVTGDGRRRLQISDDGEGIPAGEVELAFMRHATSKLASAEDLYAIRTLGFRGEALASIASVSHMSMTTRHADDPAGTHIRYEGGQLRGRRWLGAPVGTVIAVENLFFNTPARLKFLKSEQTEKRQIATIVTRYAMAYPKVRFILEQDEREVFRTSGSGQLLDVIAVALGLDHLRNLIAVDDTNGDYHVYGYTSAPDLNRADRSKITLFVNGRWVQDTSLTHAVVQAYHTLLMTGRYPVAVLMLDLPPADVDVNVHPTKAEVRFRQADLAFAAVQRAVRRAVIEQGQTPSLRGRYLGDAARSTVNWQPHLNGVGDTTQPALGLELDAPGQFARRQRVDGDVSDQPIEASASRPRTLPMLRVVGQVGAAYIIAEGPAGMYLIDQHAAHERILYEQFMDEFQAQGRVVQYALAAQTVQLPPDQARLLEDQLPLLNMLGFELEPFGPNVFVIRGIPAILTDSDPGDTIAEIVADLELGVPPGQQTIEDKIIKRVCKRAAVKAGQVLSYEQMQGLIRQLERARSPLTCPHGRPTMIHISSDQLAREFGRMG